MPNKPKAIAEALRHLGVEVPDEAKLNEVLVAAARAYKLQQGIDPGPRVSLSLTPLPGVSKRAPVVALGNKHLLIANILRELGQPVPEDRVVQQALIAMARKIKADNGLDPGPQVKLALTAIPAALK